MVYGPIGHVWDWKPKGPGRRFTGDEVALYVLGSTPAAGIYDGTETWPIQLPADTLEVLEEGTCKHGDTWWPGCCAPKEAK